MGFFVSASTRAAAAKALSFWAGTPAEGFADFFLTGAFLASGRLGLRFFEARILAGIIVSRWKVRHRGCHDADSQHSYLGRQPTSSSFGIILRVWRSA